ncbi:MAG: M15 family metallopeptidase [Merdibacter sp.]
MLKFTEIKINKKITVFSVIMITALICAAVVCLNLNVIRLAFKGYDAAERGILLQYCSDEIDEYLSYDKIIDISQWDQFDNKHHYLDYELLKNKYEDREDIIAFTDNVYDSYYQTLTDSGYSLSSIRKIMQTASLDDFSVLENNHYTWEDIAPYMKVNGAVIQDIPAYIESKLDPEDAVMQISYKSIDSSKAGTSDRKYAILEPDALDVLVKNGFYLPASYEPDDLCKISIPVSSENETYLLRKEAADALQQMYEDAKKEGLEIAVVSAYRSYEDQKEIYDYYFSKYDELTASRLVSIPGCSEHQLGLSVDLTSKDIIGDEDSFFVDTPEYRWVIKHAHEYGFILRYPDDKTSITGTTNEPWHFRYVGTELAEVLYKENLTLEEYTLENGFSYPLSVISS